MKLSLRDVIGYIGQSPNSGGPGIPYTSNDSNPQASEESATFMGRPNDSYFCPNCKSTNLFYNKEKGIGYCDKCQGRFSITNREDGNSFRWRALPRGTGLLDPLQGGNAYPPAHDSTQYGGGSASKSWGTNSHP